jgi:hypothetical protein
MEESPIDNILARATGQATSNSAVDKVYDAVEGVYDSLGMMKGESAPAKRLLFTGAVAGGLAYAIKPRVSFDEKGAARPWVLTSPSHPRATYFPWFMWAGIGGLLGGFFV